MKSSDPASIIKSLLNRNSIDNYSNSSGSDDSHDSSSSSSSTCASMLMSGPLIKTCGMINVDDVKVSLSSGANLIGSNRSNDKILTFINIHLSINPSIYLFLHPSINPFFQKSFHPSIFLYFMHPSIDLFSH